MGFYEFQWISIPIITHYSLLITLYSLFFYSFHICIVDFILPFSS